MMMHEARLDKHCYRACYEDEVVIYALLQSSLLGRTIAATS